MTNPTDLPAALRRLSIEEAASQAGVAASTLRNYIEMGLGPEVTRIGRRIVMTSAALEAWIASEPPPAPRRTSVSALRPQRTGEQSGAEPLSDGEAE